MQRQTVFAAGVLALVLLGGGIWVLQSQPSSVGCSSDDNASAYPATVTLSEGDQQVVSVDVQVADVHAEQYLGLSAHDCLSDDRGMLFVYDRPANHTFVMREMDFGIDIVYVDADGCVRQVHAAPEPGPNEIGAEQEYPGYGQYVVEVPIGVVSDTAIEPGDPVRIAYDDTVVDGHGSCFDS